MKWTRDEFESDKTRYEISLAALIEGGYSEEHPLVRRARRRLLAVERVLNDPQFDGLMEEGK